MLYNVNVVFTSDCLYRSRRKAATGFQKSKIVWKHARIRYPIRPVPRLDMDYALQIRTAQELARSGQYEKAAIICQELTAHQPKSHEAWHLQGVLHNLSAHPADALDCIKQAIAIEPGIAKYYLNLGNAYLYLNQIHEAQSSYEKALELDGCNQDAHFNLALLLRNLDDNRRAEFHFKKAVQGPVPMSDAWAQLAAIQEHENRLEEASRSVENSLALEPGNPLSVIVEAKLLRRKKQPAEALDRLLTLSHVRLSPRLSVGYYHEMGLLHDQLGQTDQAFEDFVRANQAQFEDPAAQSINPANYLLAIEQLAEASFGENWRPHDVAENEPSPVFLIGFPRSGTTLLDQILDSHPSIQTLEEIPIILTLVKEYGALAAEFPPDREARRQIQDRYFELVLAHINLSPGSTLIDKLPLNINTVPLIVRVFPNARFILALRHPLDVCLSCFMQPFGPNEVMLNFASLDSTAQLYHHTMRLWLRIEHEMGLTVHRIRYEDLVQDFDTEVKRLLAFLELPWDDRVREFATHAAGRGRINTPSYHQVTRQLNRDAIYRWRRYERQLGAIVPVLEPYIKAYGYSDNFPPSCPNT